MSKEVWGDEGDVPVNIKDTAMYQEFMEINARWMKWKRDHEKYEFPNDEFIAAVEATDDAMAVVYQMLEDDE